MSFAKCAERKVVRKMTDTEILASKIAVGVANQNTNDQISAALSTLNVNPVMESAIFGGNVERKTPQK